MRIWSVHPKYLDSKGLVALWRETLLAKHVLEGKTKGYKNHPQLLRFKTAFDPIGCINFYLSEVFTEAKMRGYNFNNSKIDPYTITNKIAVTTGQLEYELQHLRTKLKIRDEKCLKKIAGVHEFALHPLFELIAGDIEAWEVIK